jgi:DNA processing protein
MPTESSGQEAQLYWLALHLVPGLGARNALKLIRTFGDPQGIFHASLSELRGVGLRAAVAEAIHAGISFEDASGEAGRVAQAGVDVVTFQDPRYPERLKEIFDPPILLYARGRIELLRTSSVALVGSRRPTPYGQAVSEKLARDLADLGLTVVSGMARGIDSFAHRGALQSSGDTIAVLGCGVDVVYPRENQKMADEVGRRGLIVSEFPMGSTAFPQNFPVRNRIISGISLGVMIVEGAQYSGSLITARLALDQGREVFAVPGSIVSKLSWGPNLLIKQGAKLVQDAADVLEEMPLEVRQRLARAVSANGTETETETSTPRQASFWQEAASPLARELLTLLRVDSSMHIDEIIRTREQLSPSEILSALGELELFGVVKQLPGKYFVRVWI